MNIPTLPAVVTIDTYYHGMSVEERLRFDNWLAGVMGIDNIYSEHILSVAAEIDGVNMYIEVTCLFLNEIYRDAEGDLIIPEDRRMYISCLSVG